ncbi:MAG: POTRA domain-containing protein, partial [Gammaproteobacteria bacterium]
MFKKPVLIFLLSALVGCSGLPFIGNKNGKDTAAGSSEPVVGITVKGVDESIAQNIRVHMGISRYQCTTPVELIKRRNDKTLSEIRNAVHAYGYYLAEIDIAVEKGEECPSATITVVPGKRMQVAEVLVNIDGAAAGDSEFQDEIKELPIKQGKLLNHDDYRRSKALIESVAAELGYLDGRYVTSTLTVDIENYVARVALHYDSGERYQLGTITINQQPEFLDEGLV